MYVLDCDLRLWKMLWFVTPAVFVCPSHVFVHYELIAWELLEKFAKQIAVVTNVKTFVPRSLQSASIWVPTVCEGYQQTSQPSCKSETIAGPALVNWYVSIRKIQMFRTILVYIWLILVVIVYDGWFMVLAYYNTFYTIFIVSHKTKINGSGFMALVGPKSMYNYILPYQWEVKPRCTGWSRLRLSFWKMFCFCRRWALQRICIYLLLRGF